MTLPRPTHAHLPALALLLLLAALGTALAVPPEAPPPRRARPAEGDDASRSAATGSGAFERALGLPVGNSNILHRQALKKVMAGDLAGAMADLDFAIRLSPNDSRLYADRGFVKQRTEDSQGAMADWSRAIELDPKNSLAYGDRGSARLDQGDFAGANADLMKSVELDRRSAGAYLKLANAENVQRDYMNAWADYRSACDYSERPPDYAQLAICLIRMRIGEGAAGAKRLEDYFKENGRTRANAWTSQIADYLLGKLPEADLLAAATPEFADAPEAKPDAGLLCEAWYYIGMKKLLSHDKAGAAKAFQECLATGQKWYVEYQFAQVELKDLTGGG